MDIRSKLNFEIPGVTKSQLFDFVTAYIDCGLCTETDDAQTLDANYSFDDIADAAMNELLADCETFLKENAPLIHLASSVKESYTFSNAGYDFLLTRNGHGAGFWDRGNEPIWDLLTEKCKEYTECNLYVGDDNKIYAFSSGKKSRELGLAA